MPLRGRPGGDELQHLGEIVLTGPLTPDECVAVIVRAYGRERRRGISQVQAIQNVAKKHGVREDAVRFFMSQDNERERP